MEGTNCDPTSTGTLAGDCQYCANGYLATSSLATGVPFPETTCVLASQFYIHCDFGYSDNANGIPTFPGLPLTGNCKYCAKGYSDIAV